MLRKFSYHRIPIEYFNQKSLLVGLLIKNPFLTMAISGPRISPYSSEPKLLVLAGPSGTGKSTLLKRLFGEYPDLFGFSVSHTTRAPRPSEEHGKHYYFTNWESMKRDIDEGKFIEHAIYSGNHYGTSIQAVMSILDQGKVCVLDIDMQGVKAIKNHKTLAPRSFYLFIMPPSLRALEERLRSRNSETDESLERRMVIAKEEIAYAKLPNSYDSIIVNDDLDHAYEEFKKIALKCFQPQLENVAS
jgi:guanylate kinase